MSNGGPVDQSEDSGAGDDSQRPIVNIENFNHAASDLEELRKIAELDPQLARHVVDQRDRSDQREHTSERIGMVMSATLAVFALGAVLALVLLGGFWKLVIGVAVIVVVAALLRVVLTGEWSDTSWTGKMVTKAASLFGGLPPPEDDKG